jgi:tetratricopeptide (TPR) repeat protein
MLLFAMGLMCKPMLVTLPVVLLLLDYWPLRRVEPRKLSGLVLEKLPLLALSAASCVATLLAQHKIIKSAESFTLPLRLANALAACMVYLGQMVYPAGLAVFYPYPNNGLPPLELLLAAMLLAGLSAAAVWQRREQPWMLVGWVWCLVMLLPVLGIIQVGNQAHADRYTYLPQIGMYMAVTWLVAAWGAKWRVGQAALGGLMAAVLAVLMVCAGKQTMYWQNSETLWTRDLACTSGSYVAHNNLGDVLHEEGRMDEAIAQYQEAMQIDPDYADANLNFGNILLEKGRLDEAIVHFQKALQNRPDFVNAYNSLGNALHQEGRMDEAIAQYQKALQINPDFTDAHHNLAIVLQQKGRVDEAIAQYQEALLINPDFAGARVNLGIVLLNKGKLDEAIVHFQKAVEIKPDLSEAHFDLGVALLQKGEMDGAIDHFQTALRLKPAQPAVQNRLAWLLATCPQASLRDGKRAVELASQANHLSGGENPIILHTLAAAFAEAGRFSEAVETAQHALRRAGEQSKTGLAEQLQSEMKLYQAGKPFHSPEQTKIKK